MLKPARFAALAVLISTSLGADGVLEINQACALNGGCFAGDSAGFPVTIDGSAGVSYRLTGSLDLGIAPDTTAIEIDGPHITLDLNGFEIAGPITCTGSGSTLNCGAVGNGDGINLSMNADYVTVRNGTIRNMSRHGIGASGNRLRVKDVTALNNARDGLNGGLESIAVNCMANENGNDGFQFGSGSVIEQSTAAGNGEDGIRIESSNGVINNSTARNNGLQGFEMGHSSKFGKNSSSGNGAVDTCGGGVCSEKKRFYMTQTQHQGDDVLGVCASGFHTAALWEIHDPTQLTYDYLLGRTEPDSGMGPPGDNLGWIRNSNRLVFGNCELWTVNDEMEEGSTVGLRRFNNWREPAEFSSPWVYLVATCDDEQEVWCVED